MRSYDPDHRLMKPPHLKLQREGSGIKVWDLRVTMPNVGYLDPAVLHTLEHFLGHQLPVFDPEIAMAAPLGCGTGLYIVTTDKVDERRLSGALQNVLRLVGQSVQVPLATIQECGRYQYHDLPGAQAVAQYLLDALKAPA